MKHHGDYFKRYLERYKRSICDLKRIEHFASIFGSDETDIILDAGCGVGAYTHYLRKKNRNVISVDVSVDALRIGKEHYKIPCPICCDILHLPFRGDSFSKMIIIEVVEHIKKQSALFSELRRVLRIGGMLFVTTSPIESHTLLPLIETASRRRALHKIFHFYDYTTEKHAAIQHPRTLKESLRKHGFEIVKEKYWNALHSFHYLTLIGTYVLPFAYTRRFSNLLTVLDDFLDNISICNDMIVLARRWS